MQCCLVYMVKLSKGPAYRGPLRLLLSLEASWHAVTDLPAPKIALQTRRCSLTSIHGLHQVQRHHSSGGIFKSVVAFSAVNCVKQCWRCAAAVSSAGGLVKPDTHCQAVFKGALVLHITLRVATCLQQGAPCVQLLV